MHTVLVCQGPLIGFPPPQIHVIRFDPPTAAQAFQALQISGVAPANQTEESEVCELPGRESGTGSGTRFCLFVNATQPPPPKKKGVPEQNSGILPGKFSNLPDPPILVFFVFLVFFFSDFPCFFVRFPFLFEGF